ncbi:MAG: hypothetical protein ABSF22_00320 [Bryobacteraceae bacterium]
MATDHILALLLIERDKLTEAIEALQGHKTPAKVEEAVMPPTPVKRKLSAAGRKAIIAATKKRWAAIKAAKATAASPAKTAVPATPAAPKTSPAPVAVKREAPPANAAFRKKMSDRMKAAWAARKKKASKKAK